MELSARKIVIFGNSGSGKTTLSNKLVDKYGMAHLDLDTCAWRDSQPPTRKPLEESQLIIRTFKQSSSEWIIEGCYADLMADVMNDAEQLIFLNPGLETCLQNCRSRPWEPHKYESLEAQNNNLEMLINWVKEYETREDEFSLKHHRILFDNFSGHKLEVRTQT